VIPIYSGGITLSATQIPMPTRNLTGAWASFQAAGGSSLVQVYAYDFVDDPIDPYPAIDLQFGSDASLGACVGPVSADRASSLSAGPITDQDGATTLGDLQFDGGTYSSPLAQSAWDGGDALIVTAEGSDSESGIDGFATTVTAPPLQLVMPSAFSGGLVPTSVSAPFTIQWTAGAESVLAVMVDLHSKTAIACLVPSSAGGVTIPPSMMSGFQPNDFGSISIYPATSTVATMGNSTVNITVLGYMYSEMLLLTP
jgi:hypothetical protein